MYVFPSLNSVCLFILFSEVRDLSSERADQPQDQRPQIQHPSGWLAVRGARCDEPVRASTAGGHCSGKHRHTDLEDPC